MDCSVKKKSNQLTDWQIAREVVVSDDCIQLKNETVQKWCPRGL